MFCVLFLTLAAVLLPSASFAQTADLVVQNATVITMESNRSTAEALAVAEGRFIAVGSSDALRRYVGPDTRVIDLGGRVVVPGLIDAHLHPMPDFALGHRLHRVDLSSSRVSSIADLTTALRAQARSRPAGDWVLGFGYEDTALGRHPNRRDLDAVSDEHPVFIVHSSGHRAVANGNALALAGIEDSEADPPGGAFGRDTQGRLNGVVMETAMKRLQAAQRSAPTREEIEKGVAATLRRFAALGLTTVVDATPSADVWLLPVYESLRAQQRLPVRVVVMIPVDLFDNIDLSAFVADDWLSVGPVKVFHGNSLSGRTAWLSKPYVGRPDDFGIAPARDQLALNALVGNIDRRGYQAAIHSNGDREIDMVLTALETLPGERLRQARHRIEHASVMTPALLQRARNAHIVLALHSYVYEHGDKMEDYGASRWEWMHVNRRALDLDIVVAGNSDYPISGASPLLRFQSLTTRLAKNGKEYGVTQKIGILEALATYTRGAAYSVFQDDDKGTIEPGKLADFTVLEVDLRRVEPERLGEVGIHSTWVGGRRFGDAN